MSLLAIPTVRQKHPQTGCIPTCLEVLLRFGNTQGIDFETFQEDFDLERRGVGDNNLGSVTSEVTATYPQARFQIEKFGQGRGQHKLNYLLDRLDAGLLTVASLVVMDRQVQGRRQVACHMMPLIGRDGDRLLFAEFFDSEGVLHPRHFSEADVVQKHNGLALTGDDVVHLLDH